MIKFMHIAPTCLMEEIDKMYNKGYNMLLAHLVLNNPNYLKQAKKLKGIKYLDNSYFELGYSLSVSKMLKAGKLIKATHLICPDGTKRGLVEFKQAGFKVICIPETVKQMKEFIADDNIDLVGVSSLYFNRLEALVECLVTGLNKKIHLLGMGQPEEFVTMAQFRDDIVTWDTSAAIWQGHLGIIMSPAVTKDRTPVNFDESVSINLFMEQNINYMEECNVIGL